MSTTTVAPPRPVDRYARRVRREVPLFGQAQDLHGRILSSNVKTGWSVNLPILETCEPSEVCRAHCYACAGWFVKTVVSRHAIAVLQWFRRTPTVEAARLIGMECREKRIDSLRWNGSGDLVPETTAVINALALRCGWLTSVVFSRKPDEINALLVHPNIVVNVSLDRASMDLPALITRPGVRYTYLRDSPEDIPPAWTPDVPIEVVFPVRRPGYESLPHDARDCGADTGRMALAGACAACRRCLRSPNETWAVYVGSAQVATGGDR